MHENRILWSDRLSRSFAFSGSSLDYRSNLREKALRARPRTPEQACARNARTRPRTRVPLVDAGAPCLDVQGFVV